MGTIPILFGMIIAELQDTGRGEKGGKSSNLTKEDGKGDRLLFKRNARNDR